jgi:hypothetical protein
MGVLLTVHAADHASGMAQDILRFDDLPRAGKQYGNEDKECC